VPPGRLGGTGFSLWCFDMSVFKTMIERDEEGFYVASVPELHRCHTQAQSLDVLVERIREAIELCLEVPGEPAI
jgi:predicted RNase H-like HicB family nuclease